MTDNDALAKAVLAAITDPQPLVAYGENVADWQSRAVLEAIRPFLAKPPKHDPMTDCTCEPGDPLNAGVCEYRMLGDAIDEAFNPPGDDVAEVAILITAVERIAAFVRELPCRCTLEMAMGADPCDRCRVIGQLGGKPVQR
ncbi:MAG TPA: hypothetical protein VK599_07575 [Streptosporangiaceae bacterium]|nr:hypothetical protein [Streptosporangiaceae bacterium]